mmetsp:Transcript_22137/g.48167  ORF Transcript_22137/g.48167 Transcript_22137/m.48167 type:complete len:135 (+) Transcript_22137:1160-1564(+)
MSLLLLLLRFSISISLSLSLLNISERIRDVVVFVVNVVESDGDDAKEERWNASTVENPQEDVEINTDGDDDDDDLDSSPKYIPRDANANNRTKKVLNTILVEGRIILLPCPDAELFWRNFRRGFIFNMLCVFFY